MALSKHPVADKPKPAAKKLALPVLVAGSVDVGRLIRELEDIDDNLLQLGIRAGGSKVSVPKTSRLMDQTVELNKLNLLHVTDRKHLKEYLTGIHAKAPVMHMSFSSDPSAAFIEKLMTWLRKEIHPDVLLTVGLQPNLGVGCILRTTNKQFDLSMRQDFAKSRDLLLASISGKPNKVAA